ncbi:hypothetical protein CJJ23_00080 [Mycoplasmopsis agassizii]|uniref:Thioredoxin n=1 Tax=Mycoplasmopsis agassizii TaxID=33922 RepID=A0A269TKQ1_9BACT|nr:thioredoxin domain-containing protein [Mycoplasmopsis agassizii]PAK21730.1 hypothetical protein CJJ23_00080 [Mycoplasmopsis agassizii]
MVFDVTKKDIKDLDKGLKVVNFHATWCGPCKMLKPVLRALGEEYGDKVTVYHVDVDQDREYAIEMGIQGTPTSFIYKDGIIIKTIVGYTGKDTFKSILDQNL